jgi:hypothetical protein
MFKIYRARHYSEILYMEIYPSIMVPQYRYIDYVEYVPTENFVVFDYA